jgi:hypothetical protein
MMMNELNPFDPNPFNPLSPFNASNQQITGTQAPSAPMSNSDACAFGIFGGLMLVIFAAWVFGYAKLTRHPVSLPP